MASKPKIGGLEISKNHVFFGQQIKGFYRQLASRKAVKKVVFFVKKLVFATKGLKEEALLDYFARKLHFFVKKDRFGGTREWFRRSE